MSARGMHIVFDKVKDVWQLNRAPVTQLASNWQLTSLACKLSHNNQFD